MIFHLNGAFASPNMCAHDIECARVYVICTDRCTARTNSHARLYTSRTFNERVKTMTVSFVPCDVFSVLCVASYLPHAPLNLCIRTSGQRLFHYQKRNTCHWPMNLNSMSHKTTQRQFKFWTIFYFSFSAKNSAECDEKVNFNNEKKEEKIKQNCVNARRL